MSALGTCSFGEKPSKNLITHMNKPDTERQFY